MVDIANRGLHSTVGQYIIFSWNTQCLHGLIFSPAVLATIKNGMNHVALAGIFSARQN